MKFLHFGLHEPGNAGDTLLFQAVRDIFDKRLGKNEWILRNVHRQVTLENIKKINDSNCNAIIIGGGGLFLSDTNKNPNSGWQFNCSTSLIRKINKPIIVFAVGYNRFRGQNEFVPVFRENIRELVNRSIFFGLRNVGSVQKTAKYLYRNKSKLTLQPCPTTLLSYLYPEKGKRGVEGFTRKIAINMAFDRRNLRFTNRESKTINEMRKLISELNKLKYDVDIVCHCGNDAEFASFMRDEKYRLVWLAGRPYRDVLQYYRCMPITIGMRGHAQMIPFGAGNAILSLITHDKLRFFLEDIRHKEFGIEVSNPGVCAGMLAKINYIEKHWERVRREISIAKNKMLKITMHNIAKIAEELR